MFLGSEPPAADELWFAVATKASWNSLDVLQTMSISLFSCDLVDDLLVLAVDFDDPDGIVRERVRERVFGARP